MKKNNTTVVFFELVKAGLWEGTDVNLNLALVDKVDWERVYLLSEEQAVVGLVTAGIERLKNANFNLNINQEQLLQMIGDVQIIEQTNKSMNKFIESLVERMRDADIYTLLVKGQGIAQCYERPLWRASGDVDFLLSGDNYVKAKDFLIPLSSTVDSEGKYSKHQGLRIDSWEVEIQGSLRTGLSERLDKVIDSVHRDLFYGGNVRSWINGKTHVFLPGVNNDVFLVFTHFLKHLYKEEGPCLRQLCDLCRLLWTYRKSLDEKLLEKRLKDAGIYSEWKAIAAVLVEYLGMPIESMPLYSAKKKWMKKANRVVVYILSANNKGRVHAAVSVFRLFPYNTLRFLPGILFEVNILKVKERLLGTKV